jgi:hypothetical protein
MRGNIQFISGGQTRKMNIITLYLNDYLVTTICQRKNHSNESVERYTSDFERGGFSLPLVQINGSTIYSINSTGRLTVRWDPFGII